MREFTFSVDGEPVPKGRPRCECSRGHPHIYNPDETTAAQEAIGWAFKDAHPGHEPLECECSVLMMFVTDDVKADIDNYEKLVLDGLNKIAWKDDRQVRHLTAHITPTLGFGPYTNVQIRTLEPEE